MGQVHVLGVRHHGPGSARAVLAALEALDPDAVFVEGPPELDEVVALAASPSMRPPVAALVYAPDEPRRASFYPMASFSPEWVALRWAFERDRPVRFGDLPAANLLAPGDAAVDDDEPSPAPTLRADPLAALAAAAGFDDPERWWEDALEHRHHGLGVFEVVNDAMAEVRAGADHDERDLVREAAMRRVLRRMVGEGLRRVAVVCGAWHGPALVPERWPSSSSDAARLRGLPRIKVAATWVPWTSKRLTAASGYGAGVSSPGWYHQLFTAPDEPVTRWLVRTARVLRDEQFDTSSAAVIEATRLADALAALRGRPLPGLTELWEASESVLCGGSPVPMRLVADRLLVGDDIGAVPPDTPLVPLARDLAVTQRRLRLKPAASATILELDLRTPSHLERSVLFHRLLLLGVDWAVPTTTGRSMGTFREAWALEWRPELNVAVIAASAAGTTIETAAIDTIARQVTDADIAELCALVERALLADLPAALEHVMAALAERTALQHDTLRLMASVEPLARVRRYGDVRGANTEVVGRVLGGIVTRIAVGLPSAAASLGDEAAEELRAQIDAVERGVGALDDPQLRSEWLDSLSSVLAQGDVHGLVAGRAARLLLDGGRLSSDEAGRRLSFTLSSAGDPAQAAAFLEGFLQGDALLLLHDQALLALIDGWLTQVRAETFDDLLPVLRRAFSTYEPAERRMIGEKVRHLEGGAPRPFLDDAAGVDERRAALVQPLVRQLLGLAPVEADRG